MGRRRKVNVISVKTHTEIILVLGMRRLNAAAAEKNKMMIDDRNG